MRTMKTIKVIALISILLSFEPSWAADSWFKNACSMLFGKPAISESSTAKAVPSTQALEGAQLFSSFRLQEVGRVPGRFGGSILTIGRKSLGNGQKVSWEDYSTKTDLPGDMRWALHDLAPAIKGLFSFSGLGKDLQPIKNQQFDALEYVTVPNWTEVHTGLEALKSLAQKQNMDIAILNFYSTDKVTGGRKYLSMLAEELKLPMTSQGHAFEHDLNFHFVSSFFTPTFIARAMQNRAQIVLEFEKFLKEYPRRTRSQAQNFEVFETVMRKELMIDVIYRMDTQANFVNIYNGRSAPGMIEEIFKAMLMRSYTPRDYLVSLVSHHFGEVVSMNRSLAQDFQMAFDEFLAGLSERYSKEDVPRGFFDNPNVFKQGAEQQLRDLETLASQLMNSR